MIIIEWEMMYNFIIIQLKRYQTQFNFDRDKSAEIEQLQIELHDREQDVYNLTEELNISKKQFDKLSSDFELLQNENSKLTNEIKLLNEKTKAITQRLEIIQNHQSQPEGLIGIEASHNAEMEKLRYEYESKIDALKTKVFYYYIQIYKLKSEKTPSSHMIYDNPPVMPPKPIPAPLSTYSQSYLSYNDKTNESVITESPKDDSLSNHSDESTTIIDESTVSSYATKKYPDYEELLKKYKSKVHQNIFILYYSFFI